jgi:hypothetical protein
VWGQFCSLLISIAAAAAVIDVNIIIIVVIVVVVILKRLHISLTDEVMTECRTIS